MRVKSNSGFVLSSAEIRNNIFVPRYYDPRIDKDLNALRSSHELLSVAELVQRGDLEHSHGDYVPKIFYGTGEFPYIRTSDIANWELRASPKHGVAADVFEEYHEEQDVQPGDILFVHEGTYLIGVAGMVTKFDGPMLYQHHLAKFRVTAEATFAAGYLLAALGSPICQRQIRSKQFSADVIDSVVGRLEEVVIPIPKNPERAPKIAKAVEDAVIGRAELREKLTHALVGIESALRCPSVSVSLKAAKAVISGKAIAERSTYFLGGRAGFTAFAMPTSGLKDEIYIPKYYDPTIRESLKGMEPACDLISIGALIDGKQIALNVGDEIGRLAYGTGTIPFIRTSDLATYELKADSKHGVSQAICDAYSSQGVSAGDILLVRDGTYLVGSSALIFAEDLPLLYCGGIYKISTNANGMMTPGLLYALLNLPVTRRQLRSKQFTRDVIDTLGHRIREVVLPVPKSPEARQMIGSFIQTSCGDRVRHRAVLTSLCNELFDLGNAPS